MKTFRSSILSFDTLNLEGWKAAGLRNEILVAILLLIGAELLARSVLAPIGDYWRYWEPEVAVKIETYRAMVRKGAPPHILIVGDSTGEFDIDPVGVADDSMSEGPDVYNLAWAANRAEAFRKCTLPILAKGPMSELVVVSLSPDAFIESRASRQSEQAITSSSFCKNLNGERSVADYLYLARVRWAWPFLESWWSGRKLPYAPNSGGFAGLDRDFGRVPARFADGRRLQTGFRAATAHRSHSLSVECRPSVQGISDGFRSAGSGLRRGAVSHQEELRRSESSEPRGRPHLFASTRTRYRIPE